MDVRRFLWNPGCHDGRGASAYGEQIARRWGRLLQGTINCCVFCWSEIQSSRKCSLWIIQVAGGGRLECQLVYYCCSWRLALLLLHLQLQQPAPAAAEESAEARAMPTRAVILLLRPLLLTSNAGLTILECSTCTGLRMTLSIMAEVWNTLHSAFLKSEAGSALSCSS